MESFAVNTVLCRCRKYKLIAVTTRTAVASAIQSFTRPGWARAGRGLPVSAIPVWCDANVPPVCEIVADTAPEDRGGDVKPGEPWSTGRARAPVPPWAVPPASAA